MCTIDNINALLKAKKKSQKELCDFLGVSKSVFTDWKAGRNNSYQRHLPKIAKFFDVSVDYLLGEEDTAPKNEDGAITDPLEARLMESVRQLSDDQKKLLLAQLDTLLADKEK